MPNTGSLGEGVSSSRGLPGGTGGGGGSGPAATSGGPGSVSASGGAGEARECAGCGKIITERYLLKALDLFWHEDCLKCGCCDCRLGEVGSTLYTKANLILCKRDYLRLFGTTGYCAACSKVIPAFEMVMRAKSNVYHLECFACQQCNHRFCVGDRFYLCDNKILCEYDYEERLVFANMAYNPSSLAHIRRQVGNLQPSGDDMMGGTGNGHGALSQQQAPPTSSLCPSMKDASGLPVFCNEKQTWSPSRDVQGHRGLVPGGGALASGDEEASSGYGSPDSQPECPPPAPVQLHPPAEAR
ncbi:hypothetical protein B566_EDAN003089 [Ephemera danica]|nr:hypothetical protein B566_EDAN003089 [Ephemera danica]